MEKLTVATLEWLPTAAVFVIDLTEECGCSVQQQWQVRSELLQRFPHKLWIDVLSKADLLEEEFNFADEAGAESPSSPDALPHDAVQMVRSCGFAFGVEFKYVRGTSIPCTVGPVIIEFR